MNIRQFVLSASALLALAQWTEAKPRSLSQMQQAATSVWNGSARYGFRAPQNSRMQRLQSDSLLTVWGNANGGYVIVAVDDNLPAVLGYSSTPYANTAADNPNFKWWLESVRRVAASISRSSAPHKTTLPEASGYPADVAPMVSCHWGQSTPYNDLCPMGPYLNAAGQPDGKEYGRSLTGCAATAISQIMYSLRYPLNGSGGECSVGVPYANPTATYTVDFDNATYDWANMIDDYTPGNYTDAQATAVATIMYHAGVALDMQYSATSSGTYARMVVTALKRNFGFPETVRLLNRDDYTEQQWMNTIYNELSNGHPIQYNGADQINGGHAFVFDGYNADGMVHVNWGWEGQKDGYYNVSLLDPQGWHFTQHQSMVIGISKKTVSTESLEVEVSVPGTLVDQIPADKTMTVGRLKVKGCINGTDLRLLRKMAGRDADNAVSNGNLSVLDLSEARIVKGGEAYLDNLCTVDDQLPDCAFYGCDALTWVVLPSTLTHIGDGAFGMCYSLENLSLTPAKDADFTFDGTSVVSSDGSRLIAVMPYAVSTYKVPEGVKTISDYAFAGCIQLSNVSLPQCVENIGKKAFEYDYNITQLWMYPKTAPCVAGDTFEGMDANAAWLYLWHDTYQSYADADGWQRFFGENPHYKEFGTTIKAKNAKRKVGKKNPKFGYQINGDWVDGTPELTCEADEASPAGTYPIVVKRGTITADDVEFENGTLTVVDNATSVESVSGVLDDLVGKRAYTIAGQRVTMPSSGQGKGTGLFVVDGKKIVR